MTRLAFGTFLAFLSGFCFGSHYGGFNSEACQVMVTVFIAFTLIDIIRTWRMRTSQ